MVERFSDSIWDFRLQVLWVAYTALYIAAGSITQERFVSSLLSTIGGGLIVAVILHTLLEEHSEKTNSTLFIALAACVFLVQESYKTYSDILGSVFAFVFALLAATLLWIRDENPIKWHFKYTSFVVMITTIVCSFVQLLVTVFIKFVQNHFMPDANYYVIGYHVSGIFAALICSLWFGRSLLPPSLPNNESSNNKLSIVKLISLILFMFMVIGGFFMNDKRMLDNFGYLNRSLIVSLLYSSAYVLTLWLCLYYLLKSKTIYCRNSCALMFLGVFPLVSSFLSCSIIWFNSVHSGDQYFLVRWIVFEAVPSFTLGGAILLSIYLGKKTSNYMQACKAAKLPEKTST